MNWFPGWLWFVTPSGGPVLPGFMGWVDGIKRRPLVAHPIGAALVVGVFGLVFNAFPSTSIAAALLAESVNQYYKAVGGAYGQWLWREVIWRLILAFGGAVLALLVLP